MLELKGIHWKHFIFSTLYTNILPNKLKYVPSELIKVSFREKTQYITFKKYGTKWILEITK